MEALLELQNQYPVHITIAIVVAILGLTWIIEHIVFKAIRRIGQIGFSPLPASTIFANIARVVIWLAGIALMFRVCFDYDVTALIAALGVGGIAISLGLQDTLSNLIGGLQVSLGKIVQPGQYVEVLSQRGKVTDVTWRHTTIVDTDGCTHLIPNSLINKNALVDIGDEGLVRVGFLMPLETDLELFTRDVERAVTVALGSSIGPRGVRVRFSGEVYAGLSGNVVAHVRRADYPPEAAGDVVFRAIDPILKQVGMTT